MTNPVHGPPRPRLRFAAVLLAASAVAGSCTTLQQIVALRQVEFSLDGVTDVRLAGVPLSRAATQDLTLVDVSRVASAMSSGNLPLDLRLRLSGENPADNPTEARLVRMDWTLLLDDTETVSGVLEEPVSFPPGDRRPFSLGVSLNLVEFVDGNVRELVDLAQAVAGQRGDGTEVALRVTPTVDTPLGPIRYSETITLVRPQIAG